MAMDLGCVGFIGSFSRPRIDRSSLPEFRGWKAWPRCRLSSHDRTAPGGIERRCASFFNRGLYLYSFDSGKSSVILPD